MAIKKIKPVSKEVTCQCGHSWIAAWPSGKMRRTSKCPACLNHVLTSGKIVVHKNDACQGCHRPLLNNHHCTYCGRSIK